MPFFFSNFLIQLGRGRALDENRKCKLVAISVEFGRDIVEVSTMFEIMQLGGGNYSNDSTHIAPKLYRSRR